MTLLGNVHEALAVMVATKAQPAMCYMGLLPPRFAVGCQRRTWCVRRQKHGGGEGVAKQEAEMTRIVIVLMTAIMAESACITFIHCCGEGPPKNKIGYECLEGQEISIPDRKVRPLLLYGSYPLFPVVLAPSHCVCMRTRIATFLLICLEETRPRCAYPCSLDPYRYGCQQGS